MSHPIPVVATGKLGDLAIKSGKPIEAKITLYRGNADWTIDDLLELQETALLTIVLQPQMVQRPMPMPSTNGHVDAAEEAPAPINLAVVRGGHVVALLWMTEVVDDDPEILLPVEHLLEVQR